MRYNVFITPASGVGGEFPRPIPFPNKSRAENYAKACRAIGQKARVEKINPNKMTQQQIKERLAYLRGEIEAERISYEEIAELYSLAEFIDPGDVLLLEWAGVPENRESNA
jgi:hypothetical protein